MTLRYDLFSILVADIRVKPKSGFYIRLNLEILYFRGYSKIKTVKAAADNPPPTFYL